MMFNTSSTTLFTTLLSQALENIPPIGEQFSDSTYTVIKEAIEALTPLLDNRWIISLQTGLNLGIRPEKVYQYWPEFNDQLRFSPLSSGLLKDNAIGLKQFLSVVLLLTNKLEQTAWPSKDDNYYPRGWLKLSGEISYTTYTNLYGLLTPNDVTISVNHAIQSSLWLWSSYGFNSNTTIDQLGQEFNLNVDTLNNTFNLVNKELFNE